MHGSELRGGSTNGDINSMKDAQDSLSISIRSQTGPHHNDITYYDKAYLNSYSKAYFDFSKYFNFHT